MWEYLGVRQINPCFVKRASPLPWNLFSDFWRCMVNMQLGKRRIRVEKWRILCMKSAHAYHRENPIEHRKLISILLWIWFQAHTREYVAHTTEYLGATLPHDDSINDRTPGSKLSNGDQNTRLWWKSDFKVGIQMIRKLRVRRDQITSTPPLSPHGA